MRISDMCRGPGPRVSRRFRRGDTWVVLDGPHARCTGRQHVLGWGLAADGLEGLLLRCEGCLLSYVLHIT